MNTVAMPTASCDSSGTAPTISSVTRWKPRGRGAKLDLALDPHGPHSGVNAITDIWWPQARRTRI